MQPFQLPNGAHEPRIELRSPNGDNSQRNPSLQDLNNWRRLLRGCLDLTWTPVASMRTKSAIRPQDSIALPKFFFSAFGMHVMRSSREMSRSHRIQSHNCIDYQERRKRSSDNRREGERAQSEDERTVDPKLGVQISSVRCRIAMIFKLLRFWL